MAFNAHWELEDLARRRGLPLDHLVLQFRRDFAYMVESCAVFRLRVADSGNVFRLFDAEGGEIYPPSEAGLYAIFSAAGFLYCGEATDLCRRQIKDPDNTADSTKRFSNQGRAVLKLVLHRGWAERFGIEPLFIQMYAATTPLEGGDTFERRYSVSTSSKSLEGAASLFVHGLFPRMVARARALRHPAG